MFLFTRRYKNHCHRLQKLPILM